ncbi:hypothetical protein RHGRI_001385 [Rhododendron griersonianum]|uniref:MSP domain-containing protein n=1 Tax=Rhododendron griersonianum TaxID=479676 RepID=A0AAV6LKF0_9ERIC|nr:hypothetical protein RHGRI_001385 [Rhododendron griersonianum]
MRGLVTMQAQKEAPADMQCKDKFLLQSTVTSPGATTKDITPEMFHKESGNTVEECKLRVSYVAPPQPPSPVREGSDEGSSPRVSASDNGTLNTAEYTTASSAFAERMHVNPQDNSSEHANENENSPIQLKQALQDWEGREYAKAFISKLTQEKNSAIQQNNKLQQELEFLRRKGNRSSGGIPFIYVIIVGVLGIFLGFLLKKT